MFYLHGVLLFQIIHLHLQEAVMFPVYMKIKYICKYKIPILYYTVYILIIKIINFFFFLDLVVVMEIRIIMIHGVMIYKKMFGQNYLV